MKRLGVAAIIILALLTGGYLYLRNYLKVKDFKPDNSKSTSVLDLNPLVIAKLQQMVKDGSNGLYRLGIGKLEPDILTSTVVLTNVTFIPDSAVLDKLRNNGKVPEDVFKIKADTLKVYGLGLEDLLKKDRIDISVATISHPVIELYHEGNDKSESKDSPTLYQRLMKNMKSITIKKVTVENGKLTNYQNNKPTIFNEVEINMEDILIDPSTEYDKHRFFFAKKAALSCKNFSKKTIGNLYYFKTGSISVSTINNTLIAKRVSLRPIDSRKEFEAKLKSQKSMYDISADEVSFSNINWIDLMNAESFIADNARVENLRYNIYVDETLPVEPKKSNNFPQQLLMEVGIPINILKTDVHNASVTYEEYKPVPGKTASVYFSNINAIFSNICNIISRFKENGHTLFKGEGLFMHRAPLRISADFDLKKIKTGNFTGNAELKDVDSSMINLFSVTYGLFMIKRGYITEGSAEVKGNNFNATSQVSLLYNDLHITPLKGDGENKGGTKKKPLTSFIANMLIKNDNPSHGKLPRIEEGHYSRKPASNLFSLFWKAIAAGILKTIGLSEKLAE